MNQLLPKVNTERIWRELSDRLRQFIRSRVSSAADVDDILQTVFLRIHQNLGTLRQVERLESWVFQITRHAITDHHRKPRNAVDGTIPAVTVMERDENFNKEVAGCLAALIEQLPENQQRAVSMFELEGLTQAEIAQRESISLSGAKSRIQRGRRQLEVMLRECCQFQVDARGNVLQYRGVNDDCGPDCGRASGPP